MRNFALNRKLTRFAALALSLSVLSASHCAPKAFAENDKHNKVVAAPSLPSSLASGIVLTSPADSKDVFDWKNNKPSTTRPKIGLALGGGGARGAAHIGVLRVLEKEGIKFDVITGTSIGAVVGGLYSAGVSLDHMDSAFESGKLMKNFMTVPLTFRIAVAPLMVIPRLFGNNAYDGLYRGNKFRDYVKKDITVHDIDIETLKIPFSAVTLNLLDGNPYMIQKGNLGYAMQASTAVPGLRKPVDIGDKLLCDGGVICNLPVKQCREMGADIVIAVDINHPFGVEKKDYFRKVGSVAQRMLDWDLYMSDKAQSELADITIHPDTSGISLISRNKKDARRGVEAGEKAATEALPQIRQLLSAYQLAGKDDTQSKETQSTQSQETQSTQSKDAKTIAGEQTAP